MTNAEIRARILEHAEKVVIEYPGRIMAYGVIPHTNNKVGWYFYGWRDEVAVQFAAERDKGQ